MSQIFGYLTAIYWKHGRSEAKKDLIIITCTSELFVINGIQDVRLTFEPVVRLLKSKKLKR